MDSSQSTDRHIQETIDRLLCIKQLLHNPKTFRTAATELLDRCGDPWLFQRPVEQSLMGCLTVVSRVAAQPGYDLNLCHRLMDVCAANRDKFTPDSAALVASWCEELEHLHHHYRQWRLEEFVLEAATHKPPMSSMQPGPSHSYPSPCATITSDVSAEDAPTDPAFPFSGRQMDRYGPVPGNPMDKSSDPMNLNPDFPGPQQQFPIKDNFNQDYMQQGTYEQPNYPGGHYSGGVTGTPSGFLQASPPQPPSAPAACSTSAMLTAQNKDIDLAQLKVLERLGLKAHAYWRGLPGTPTSYPTSYQDLPGGGLHYSPDRWLSYPQHRAATIAAHLPIIFQKEKDRRSESCQSYDAMPMISQQKGKRSEEVLKESDPPFSLEKRMLEMLDFPRKRRKEIELEDSDTPFSQDAAHSSVSQQSFQHSPEQMSCDVSTTDHPATVSLFSINPSLELQDCCRTGETSSLSRSHSLPSLSQIPCIENKASFRAKRSHSLNDVILVDKTQLITPDIIVVENKELYRFHCTQAGLFQCSVTGLVFKMEAEGDVTYGTVPWNGRLLAQLGKRPAGPLFDIKCLQGSMCQLHLAHCEILSTGGGRFLAVLHVMDDGIELINPHVITETHVIINVNGFSLYGVLNDEDSPNPIRTYVSLFYTPPNGDDDSTLKVLLLPQNVVMREVINARREINGEEIYIEKPPCKLIPNQEYTLSTSPQHDSITIEPDSAAFEVYESYRNYIATFEVMLEGKFKRVMLLLSNRNTSDCPWKACVKLSGPVLKKEQVQRTLSLEVQERMLSVRSSFIESVSLPVLNSLLDKLLEVRVITDCELEMAAGMRVKNEKARFVIDIVKNKGTAASSSMLLILCDMDSCLSKHLGLM